LDHFDVADAKRHDQVWVMRPLSRRRAVGLGAIGAGLWLRPAAAQMAGQTGILALDTPAIQARNPANALLVAITRTGGRLVAVGVHGVIIYSDDNGVTWTQGSVPVDVTLTCVRFATPSLGWAAGHFGVILATTDGGATWTEQLNGIQANQLTLAAAQAAVAENSATPGAPLAMRRAAHFVDEGPDKPFLSIAVLTPQKVIVVGAYRMTMITTDGGKTWNDDSLNVYDKFSHNLYDAAGIGPDVYLAGEGGLVFRSTDGGGSFLPLAPTSDITLFGVIGPNENAITVFGVAGSSFHSADQGKTWLQVNLATQDDLTAGRIISSGAILLVSEAGAMFISKDQGNSFSLVPGIQPMAVFDIEEAPNHDLVVVGSGGVSVIPARLFMT
jgi:photosystem II stability/assembly factor-like uncharacterized protein